MNNILFNMPNNSDELSMQDIKCLVELLNEKDNNLRYQAFLLLQNRSQNHDDVFPYFDIFCEKLCSSNSYQRSLGAMLIADNARWDKQNKLDFVIDNYLLLFNDEKPITIRQSIQSLIKIIPYKSQLIDKIKNALINLDLLLIKDTMRKSILVDILTVLATIRKNNKDNQIDSYIAQALTGEILDKKAIAEIKALL